MDDEVCDGDSPRNSRYAIPRMTTIRSCEDTRQQYLGGIKHIIPWERGHGVVWCTCERATLAVICLTSPDSHESVQRWFHCKYVTYLPLGMAYIAT